MVWHPDSRRHNPLQALRRVVEAPDSDVEVADELVRRRADHVGTVRVSSASAATALAERADPAIDAVEPVVPGDEHPPAAERARPARPPQALITSTPAAGEAGPPNAGTGSHPPRHTPAGPWSTTVEAPMRTPTWLRASPRTPIGGATGTVTGRSAILSETGDEDAPGRRGGRRRGRWDPVTGRRPMTARQVLATMLVGLGLWALVDAPALYHSAVSAPIGTRRRVSMDVLRPIVRLGAALGIDRVSNLADDIVGRHYHPPTPLVLVPPAPVAPPVALRPAPASATPTVAAIPPLRVPTAADPLRVLVVGDSIGLSFGQSLANALDATGVVHTTVDAREGTGLARPDSFDWPAQLRADIVQFHPEVVVAMFGGNDDQDVQVNGRYIAFGSPLWGQLYGARVSQFAHTVTSSGARLLWSGLPVMRSAAKTARFTTVMGVTQQAVSAIPGAIFVNNYPTLAGPSGQYEDSLPDASGQQVLVREPDGIHVSPAGAGRLAAKAIADMTFVWHLSL